MDELLGIKVTYMVVQAKTSGEIVQETPLLFDRFTGTIVAVDRIDMATHFESHETALGLADLHNEISEILSQEFEYFVVRNEINRKRITRALPLTPPIATEPEEPVEEPIEDDVEEPIEDPVEEPIEDPVEEPNEP